MKNKLNTILIVIFITLVIVLGIEVAFRSKAYTKNPITTEIAVKKIDQQIAADGIITSQNEASLSFQTGGKLVSLPFKEGDSVHQGQTIAQLDTYQLQRQLTAALNTYRSTRDTFDQTQQNSQDNQLQSTQIPLTNNAEMEKSNAINDAVKRIVDQNQANLDNSVINVELANYALQFSTLTSPINGIIVHEDVTQPFVNITSATTFKIADPTNIVLRVNVPESDIDFVSLNAPSIIKLNGIDTIFQGIVTKIFPQKKTLATGEQAYQVDIQSDQLKSVAKLDQSGTVLITSNLGQNFKLIPAWSVLGHEYVWVMENGKKVLKKVQVGQTHGNDIEIINGLTPEDKVIVDPQSIAGPNYQML